MPELRITSSDADAQKALARLEGQMNKLRAELAATQEKARAASQGMTDGMQKAGGETERTGRKIKDAGEQHRRAFGAEAVAGLARYAAGFASISTAAALLKKIMGELHAEQERALAGLRGGAAPMGSLATIAGGDPERLSAMLAEVRASRAAGLSVGKAAGLQFTLESLGIAQHRALFADLGKVTEEPAGLAESIVTVQRGFPGEGVNVPGIASMLFAAAGESKTDVGKLAGAISNFSEGAAAIGGSLSEAMASAAVLTNTLKSPDVASTRIRALVDVIAKRGLGGEGLLGGVRQLEALRQRTLAELPAGAVPEEAEFQLFGSTEARNAFLSIRRQMDEIQRVAATVQAAPRQNLVGRIVESMRQTPELAIGAAVNESEERLRLTEEQAFGQRAAISRLLINESKSRAIRDEQWGPYRAAKGLAAEALEWAAPGLGGGFAVATSAAERGFGIGGDGADRVVNAIERQTQIMQRDRSPTLGRPDDDR